MLELAPVMSSSVPFTRTHWYVNVPGTPSASMMPLVSAVRVCPTCAVPEIVGSPVAASFTGVTSMVMVLAGVLASAPSLTVKVKLA